MTRFEIFVVAGLVMLYIMMGVELYEMLID
jgi:hypothetical protein